MTRLRPLHISPIARLLFLWVLLIFVLGCEGQGPARDIEWDFSKTRKPANIREEPSERATFYKVYSGPARLKLHLPGSLEITEDAREIAVWIDNDEVIDFYIRGPNGTLEDVYRRGLELMKKYEAPADVLEEFSEWHRTIVSGERNQSYLKGWDREKCSVYVEVRHSFNGSKPWYTSLVIGFPD